MDPLPPVAYVPHACPCGSATAPAQAGGCLRRKAHLSRLGQFLLLQCAHRFVEKAASTHPTATPRQSAGRPLTAWRSWKDDRRCLELRLHAARKSCRLVCGRHGRVLVRGSRQRMMISPVSGDSRITDATVYDAGGLCGVARAVGRGCEAAPVDVQGTTHHKQAASSDVATCI